MTAADLIRRLDLEPHPEGGYFRETYRSPVRIPADALAAPYDGPRDAGTCILFLLENGMRSRLHRVLSDELWLFQYGDPVRLTTRPTPEGSARHQKLGPADAFQVCVEGGHWQEAESLDGPHGFSLVACVVVPGFDFADFALAE